jgi:hypothetical protein
MPSLVRSSGGTVVSVIGSNFQASAFISCKIELIYSETESTQDPSMITSTVVPATYVSSTSILCTMPVLYGDTYLIRVASNGIHFLSSPLVINSFEPATISSVSPTVVSSAGGDAYG